MKKNICNAIFMGFLGVLGIAGHVWAGTSYTTMPATNITATTTTLNGKALSTIGLSGEIFHWGTTTDYGNSGMGAPQGVNGPVSLNITGLACNTVYHFRFTGDPKPPRTTMQGNDQTFQTAPCPIKYVSLDAGPIWSNADAPGICPNVCASAKGTWSGQWMTTQPGVMSVCGCWVPE